MVKDDIEYVHDNQVPLWMFGLREILKMLMERLTDVSLESNDLDIETEWTKTVIATNHGAHWVFHPSIIKIAFSFDQRLYELPHGRPCRRTHPIGTLAIDGNPFLAHFYITGMLNGILVEGH